MTMSPAGKETTSLELLQQCPLLARRRHRLVWEAVQHSLTAQLRFECLGSCGAPPLTSFVNCNLASLFAFFPEVGTTSQLVRTK